MSINSAQQTLSGIIAILGSLVFLFFGGMFLIQIEEIKDMFKAYELPEWLRVIVGMTELICALLLLFKATRRIAALSLAFLMIGALAVHFLFQEYV